MQIIVYTVYWENTNLCNIIIYSHHGHDNWSTHTVHILLLNANLCTISTSHCQLEVLDAGRDIKLHVTASHLSDKTTINYGLFISPVQFIVLRSNHLISSLAGSWMIQHLQLISSAQCSYWKCYFAIFALTTFCICNVYVLQCGNVGNDILYIISSMLASCKFIL